MAGAVGKAQLPRARDPGEGTSPVSGSFTEHRGGGAGDGECEGGRGVRLEPPGVLRGV